MRLYLLVIALAGIHFIATTQEALAHATVISSAPADSSVHAVAPTAMQLWFNEQVSSRFSSVRLFDHNGQELAVGPISRAATEGHQLAFALPPLTPGTYSLLWRALSEADGHFSQGMVIFGVGEHVDLGAAQVIATAAPPSVPEVVLRWFNLFLLASLVGTFGIVNFVLIPLRRAWAVSNDIAVWNDLAYRLHRWIIFCIGCALISSLGLLAWQAITFNSGAEAAALPAATWLVLTQTRTGDLWLARAVILMILLGLVWWQNRGQPGALVFLTHRWLARMTLKLGLALLTVQALSGHAAGDQRNLLLTMLLALLHLLAASLWIGGLLALAVALWPFMRRDQPAAVELSRACWRAFSPIAALSVALLLASGLYATGREVASLDALITTLYGNVLLIKVALVLIAGLVGLLNSRQIYPDLLRLGPRFLQGTIRLRTAATQRIPGFVRSEVWLGGLILLATALLTATPPPRGAEFTVAPDMVPASLSQSVDDLVITLAVKPNRPGQNVITVRSASTRRPPPAPILRVLLRFRHLEVDLDPVSATAQEVEADRYLLTGNYLKLAGSWQIDVVTRRHGLEDSVATFTWLVVPSGMIEPVVLSKKPWSRPLSLAGAGLVLVVMAAGIIIRWRMI